MYFKTLISILGLTGILILVSCEDKKNDTTTNNEIFNQWKLSSQNADVALLVRADSTFHVDVVSQEGIEVEGHLALDNYTITFINTHGSDSISSDPRPGVYEYRISMDTLRFTRINDPLARRAEFLSLPWLRQAIQD